MEVNATWLEVVAQIIFIIGGVTAGFYGLKRWIKRTAVDPMMHQVGPNGGDQQGTTRELVEQIHSRQRDQLTKLEEHEVFSAERYEKVNRRVEEAFSLATQALTIASHNSERIDRFLERKGHE